jgi:hypothetical protein
MFSFGSGIGQAMMHIASVRATQILLSSKAGKGQSD